MLAHPWLAAGAATWALVVLSLPVLGLHTKLPGLADLPRSIPVVSAYSKIEQAFPGSQTPAVVVVKAADVRAPQVRSAIADLHRRAVATKLMEEPVRSR